MNRDIGKSCKLCEWWQVFYGKRGYKDRTTPYLGYEPLFKGECRKSKPCFVAQSRDVSADFERYSTVVTNHVTAWPVTKDDDWCGEYKEANHE